MNIKRIYWDADEGGAGGSAPQGQPEPGANNNEPAQFDAAAAHQLIADLRNEAAENRTRYQDMATLVERALSAMSGKAPDNEEKTPMKTEVGNKMLGTLQAQIEALNIKLSEMDTARKAAEELAQKSAVESVRTKVAAKYGLDAKLAERLKGATAEELEADAKELASLTKGGGTSLGAGAGRDSGGSDVVARIKAQRSQGGDTFGGGGVSWWNNE